MEEDRRYPSAWVISYFTWYVIIPPTGDGSCSMVSWECGEECASWGCKTLLRQAAQRFKKLGLRSSGWRVCELAWWQSGMRDARTWGLSVEVMVQWKIPVDFCLTSTEAGSYQHNTQVLLDPKLAHTVINYLILHREASASKLLPEAVVQHSWSWL